MKIWGKMTNLAGLKSMLRLIALLSNYQFNKFISRRLNLVPDPIATHVLADVVDRLDGSR